MMQIKIVLDGVKPLSLNSVFSRNKQGRRFKTRKYVEFERLVNLKLARYKREFEMLRNAFDQTRHCLKANYLFRYPILTKNNRISKTAGDLSNSFKTIEDIVFGCIGIDDSFVTKIQGAKVHSEDTRLEITIKLEDI